MKTPPEISLFRASPKGGALWAGRAACLEGTSGILSKSRYFSAAETAALGEEVSMPELAKSAAGSILWDGGPARVFTLKREFSDTALCECCGDRLGLESLRWFISPLNPFISCCFSRGEGAVDGESSALSCLERATDAALSQFVAQHSPSMVLLALAHADGGSPVSELPSELVELIAREFTSAICAPDD